MLSLRKAFLTLGLLSVASVAQAAPIVLQADHFSVSYDDTQLGLYGAGAVSGDTVFFLPTSFTAFSGVAGRAVSTRALFELTFIADPGYAFSGLSFTERGDYLLFGGGGVNVVAGVEAVNASTGASASAILTPGAPLNVPGLPTHNWQLEWGLALQSLGSPQSLQVTLDNELFASTPTAGMGFIEKKFAGFELTVEPVAAVPEPAGWTLLLAGMMAALLAGCRRRMLGQDGQRGLLRAR